MILTFGSQRDYDALAAQDGAPAAWSAEDLAAMGTFLEKFTTDLAESGELVEVQGLAPPMHARRVQLREGAQVVTDGPYPETEEVLAGYWVVDCTSFDRATEIAARLNECPGPASESGTIIRPIADGSGAFD
jgi:hypothetical protein